MDMDSKNFKYWAFISYSHKDSQWSTWLHQKLENYKIPKNLVGTETNKGTVPRKLYPIFRDRDELPTSANVGDTLINALEQSRHLIVICSPHSAKSRWVNEEVQQFKKLGRQGDILCVIVSGEPNADDIGADETEECFAPALKFAIDTNGEFTQSRVEPIAGDLRKNGDGKKNVLMKMVAGLTGIGYATLNDRDRKRRRLRLFQAMVAVLAMMSAFVFIWQNQTKAREIALLRAQKTDSQKVWHQALSAYLADDWLMASHLFAASNIDKFDSPNLKRAVSNISHIYSPIRESLLFEHDRFEELLASLKPFKAYTWELASLKPWWDYTWNTEGGGLFVGSGSDLEFASLPTRFGVLSPDGDYFMVTDELATNLFKVSDKSLIFSDHHYGLPIGSKFISGTSLVYALSGFNGIRDEHIDVYSIPTGESILSMSVHQKGIFDIVVSPDRNYFVYFDREGGARLFAKDDEKITLTNGSNPEDELSTDMEPEFYTVAEEVDIIFGGRGWTFVKKINPESSIVGAGFSADSRYIAAWSEDNTVNFWALNPGQANSLRLKHQAKINGTLISKDSKKIISWDEAGLLKCWNARSGRLETPIMRHNSAVTHAGFIKDDGIIYSCSEVGTFYLWDANNGKVLIPSIDMGGPINRVDLVEDDKFVALTTDHGYTRIYHTMSGIPLTPKLQLSNPDVFDIRSNEDGKIILESSGNRFTMDLNGTLLLENPGPPKMGEISTVADRVISWNTDGSLFMWDSSTGNSVGAGMGHTAEVDQAKFSPKGNFILSWDVKGNAIVWSAKNGERISDPIESNKVITDAIFSPTESDVIFYNKSEFLLQWSLSDENGNKTKEIGHSKMTDLEPVVMKIWPGSFVPIELENESQKINIATMAYNDLGTLRQIKSQLIDRGSFHFKDGTAPNASDKNDPPVEMDQIANRNKKLSSKLKYLSFWRGKQVHIGRVTGDFSITALYPALIHEHPVKGAIFNESDTKLLTWTKKDLSIWDIEQGELLARFKNHFRQLKGAILSDERDTVLQWGDANFIIYRNLAPAIDLPENDLLLYIKALTGTYLSQNGTVEKLSRKDWKAAKRKMSRVLSGKRN